MTKEKIISGLKFTVEMFLFDPSTGETITEPRNDMDKITIDACRGAVELLESDDVLDKIRAEIYEEFMTIDGGVHDESAIKCMQIIDKYRNEVNE